MSLTNYGELQTGVAAWAMRSDLTALLPDFIRRAHDSIVGEVVMGADLTFADGADTVAQPSDFGRVVSIWTGRAPKRALVLSDELAMNAYGTGAPTVYRVDGTDFVIAPTPDQAYPAKIAYKITGTQFSADADTNVVLTKYPFVYLWGALAEVGAYLMDVEMAQGYEAKFRSEIARINAAEMADVMDGPLQVSPGTSYGVTP